MVRAWLGVVVMALVTVGMAQAGVVITPAPGYSITWNGNDGDYFTTANPAPAPANLATAAGATAIGSGELNAGGAHLIVHANDGLYGNSNSWIGGPTDVDPFIGVTLGSTLQRITSIAWGRDNGNNVTDACGGQCTDRWTGVYTLQMTIDPNPSATSTWTTIGTLNYQSADDTVVGGLFTPWFRHEYQVATLGGAPIPATGVRLLVPGTGWNGTWGTCVDEIEAYGGGVPFHLYQTGGGPWAGNLAPAGTAFAKDVIADYNNDGISDIYPAHRTDNLNDGLYGNSDSWIGNSTPTFAGIALAGPSMINSIAFGRDNGGEANQFVDRWAGTYTLQYTTIANPDKTTPDSDWVTIGALNYTATFPDNTGYLRHQWTFDTLYGVTGIRVLLSNGGIAIDELEVGFIPEPASLVLVGGGLLALLRRRSRRG